MMGTTRRARGDAAGEIWPALPYEAWHDALATLHMWTQIMGKAHLALVPFLSEWWEVGFTVTARGLTTATSLFGQRVFQVDVDYLDHRLDIRVGDGRAQSIPLLPSQVAGFYREFIGALEALRLGVATTTPVEVENPIPLDQNLAHAAIDLAAELKEMDGKVATVQGRLGQLQGDARTKAESALSALRASRDALHEALKKEGESAQTNVAHAKVTLDTHLSELKASAKKPLSHTDDTAS